MTDPRGNVPVPPRIDPTTLPDRVPTEDLNAAVARAMEQSALEDKASAELSPTRSEHDAAAFVSAGQSEPSGDSASDTDADALRRPNAFIAAARDDGAPTIVLGASPANEDTAVAYGVPATTAAPSGLGGDPGPPLPAAVPGPNAIVWETVPAPPRTAGNRAFGISVGLIATLVFAALYIGATMLIDIGQSGTAHLLSRSRDLVFSPVGWMPVAGFFIGYVLLALLANRAGAWAHIVLAVLVAAGAWAGYATGAIWQVADGVFPDQTTLWHEVHRFGVQPAALLAALLGLLVPHWFSGWVAWRGRRIRARNRAARDEYEQQLAGESPAPKRSRLR